MDLVRKTAEEYLSAILAHPAVEPIAAIYKEQYAILSEKTGFYVSLVSSKVVGLLAENNIHIEQFAIDLDTFPYLEFVLGVSWTIYFFEQYLAYRQYSNIVNKKLGVPQLLKKHVSEEEHLKSKAYSGDKARFAFVTSAFSQIQTTLVILYNILPWMWIQSESTLEILGLKGGNNEVSLHLNTL
jgi:hypothetical protein